MNQENSISKTFTHDMFTVYLRTDGVLHLHFNANTKITVELQKEVEAAYDELTSFKRPLIVTGDEFISVTAEARVRATKMIDKVPISCTVIAVKNLAQKMVAGFYYRFNKPKGPLKVTDDFAKGIDWINKHYMAPAI